MSKEQWMAAHEREVNDYLDRNPKASWSEAYERTADRAWDRMVDDLSGQADALRTRMKEQGE